MYDSGNAQSTQPQFQTIVGYQKLGGVTCWRNHKNVKVIISF